MNVKVPIRNTLIAITVFLLWSAWQHRWQGADGLDYRYTVDGDAKGYYSVLPAFLIFHDPSGSFFYDGNHEELAQYYNPRFLMKVDGGVVNKTYAGVGVMIAPFFMIGHTIALLCDASPDGYSWPYMLMLLLGSITYCVAGSYLLIRLLLTFGTDVIVACLTAVLVVFGTNLLYYTVIQAAMPHVYSFFLVVAFAYTVKRFMQHTTVKGVFLAGVLFGLIVLVRPVDGLVIFAIPFLAGSQPGFMEFLRKLHPRKSGIVIAVSAFAVVIAVQMLIYYWQTEHFWVWSYGEEGFRFADPHMFDFLFSFKKGLLVYTPVMLLGFFGAIPLFKRNLWSGYSYIVFLCLVCYVLSSWWSWFYGDGFGMRAMISYYPLLAIPAGLFLQQLKANGKVLQWILYLLLISMVGLNLIQNYQYRYRIIHPVEMDFDKYKYVVLKTDLRYANVVGGDDEYIFSRLAANPEVVLKENYEHTRDFKTVADNGAYDGTHVGRLESTTEYLGVAQFNANMLKLPAENYYIKIAFMRKERALNACDGALLVVEQANADGVSISWRGFRLNGRPYDDFDVWRKTAINFRLALSGSADDQFKIYFWNRNLQQFDVDDLSLEFYPMLHQ